MAGRARDEPGACCCAAGGGASDGTDSRDDVKASPGPGPAPGSGLGPSLTATGDTEDTYRPTYLRFISLTVSIRELRTPRFWRDVLCEVLVVFFLFFFLMGMCFNFHTPEESSQSIIVIGLGSGIYVFVLIEAFGHIQYAVMNPAVVPYFVYTGKIGIVKGLFFILAECLGSILGTALIYQCAPASVRTNFGPVGLHPGMHPAHGVIVECVITASLVFTIAGALDERNRKLYMPGLPIGLAVGTGILTSFHFTGGALNPVISLGPSVVTGVWRNHWIYWAGPMMAGLLAPLLYHFFTYDRGLFAKSYDGTESKRSGGSDEYRRCSLHADGCKPDGVVWTKPIKGSSTSERLSSL